MKNTNKSLRSMIFVPGYMTKFLEKAKGFKADAVILDLEDSVPEAYKEDARKYIRDYLDKNAYSQQVFIRVNDIDSGLLGKDLEAMLHENVDGFMFTKTVDERDIDYFDKLLGQLEQDHGFPQGKFTMCPLIETGSAVLRAYQIATASPRVIALAFGGEDYLTDLDGLHKKHGTSLLVPRSLIVIAARSAKMDAIDTPFLEVGDLAGFDQETALARELGFSGTLIIHPNQVEIANRAFTPSEEEIKESERVLATIEESRKQGLGVALLDGALVGPPMAKRARNVLAKVKRIEESEKSLESE